MATQSTAASAWNLVGRIRRARPGRRQEHPGWPDAIDAVITRLRNLNRSTEADFLSVTEKLTGFAAASRSMAEAAHAITDAISGEGGEGVCRALMAVLASAREMEKHGSAVHHLAAVGDAVRQIRRGLEGFEGVVASFRAMATLARIETAHLGAVGLDLGYLADEFRSSGEKVRALVAEVLDGTAEIERNIRAALREAEKSYRRSLQALPSLIERAEGGLGDFRSRQTRSAETAAKLARRSQQSASATGDIVTSIQFHDITRQQAEHVIEALEQLRAEGSPASGGRMPPGMAAALDLQVAQLAHAEAAFRDAMASLDRQLERIAQEAEGMAEETEILLGFSASGEDSFFAQMEAAFRAVTEAAAGCRALDRNAAHAIAGLDTTLPNLRKSVEEIHAVELHLRRLAINTAVSSARIGAAGEPLEAVAMAMLQLESECEATSGKADGAIGAIAERLTAARDSGSTVAAGGGFGDQLGLRSQELLGLHEATEVRIREVRSMAERLAADVAALRIGISAGRIFAEAAGECREALRRVRAQAADAGVPDSLARFERNYTMRAEREVHDAIAAIAPPVEADKTGGPPAVSPELGDNVELF